jgi:TPR repeat protein
MPPRSFPCRLLVVAVIAILFGGAISRGAPAHSGETLLEQAYRLDAGESETRDPAAAAALYLQAAEQGDPYAQVRIGYLQETGDGVDQDYTRARHSYELAAAANLPEAHLRLAICHLEGWGGPVDHARFVQELTIAAEAD